MTTSSTYFGHDARGTSTMFGGSEPAVSRMDRSELPAITFLSEPPPDRKNSFMSVASLDSDDVDPPPPRGGVDALSSPAAANAGPPVSPAYCTPTRAASSQAAGGRSTPVTTGPPTVSSRSVTTGGARSTPQTGSSKMAPLHSAPNKPLRHSEQTYPRRETYPGKGGNGPQGGAGGASSSSVAAAGTTQPTRNDNTTTMRSSKYFGDTLSPLSRPQYNQAEVGQRMGVPGEGYPQPMYLDPAGGQHYAAGGAPYAVEQKGGSPVAGGGYQYQYEQQQFVQQRPSRGPNGRKGGGSHSRSGGSYTHPEASPRTLNMGAGGPQTLPAMMDHMGGPQHYNNPPTPGMYAGAPPPRGSPHGAQQHHRGGGPQGHLLGGAAVPGPAPTNPAQPFPYYHLGRPPQDVLVSQQWFQDSFVIQDSEVLAERVARVNAELALAADHMRRAEAAKADIMHLMHEGSGGGGGSRATSHASGGPMSGGSGGVVGGGKGGVVSSDKGGKKPASKGGPVEPGFAAVGAGGGAAPTPGETGGEQNPQTKGKKNISLADRKGRALRLAR